MHVTNSIMVTGREASNSSLFESVRFITAFFWTITSPTAPALRGGFF